MSMLVLKDATVEQGGRTVLDGLSLSVAPGEVVGLLGPNGSGKTTAARALLGLVPLVRGAAEIFRTPVAQLDPRTRARRAAYLPQARPIAWPVAVEDAVALGRFAHGAVPGRLGARDRTAVDRAIARAGLTGYERRAVSSLSGGERARVHLARALAAEAPAMIADEPTAALDPAYALAMLEALAADATEGTAVLVVLHDLDLALQFCTRVILLREGRFAGEGPPADILTPETVRAVYGVRATRVDAAGRPALALQRG